MDEWHIQIDKKYLHNEAGSGAREKEREVGGNKRVARRIIESVFDARTEDRSWRRGAEGEELVARRLAGLGSDWAVIHDLTVGRKGANLDHLVIGPAGVFVLNTKNLTGKLTVYEHAVLQNGRKTSFVPAALREARIVQDRLSAATGRQVRAWSVLVVLGCEIIQKQRLANLSLIRGEQLPRWLTQLPQAVLPAGEVLTLERAARDPQTWQPTKRARASTPNPAVPPPGAPAPTAEAASKALVINRWTRYGKDRLYANTGDGVRLGYLDIATADLVLDEPDPRGLIAAQLRAAYRALGASSR